MPRTSSAMRPFDTEAAEAAHSTDLALAPEPRPVSGATRRYAINSAPVYPIGASDHDGSHREAELFYLQKQIQLQTRMVFVLEDGQQIQGVIEWYDRCSIKVRGRNRILLYKSAIKYMYKHGEVGTSPEN